MDKSIDFMKAFLMLGNLDDKATKEERVAYDTRIVFATMKSVIPDWQPPEDWDDLPLDERESRLEKLKKVI